MKKGFTLAELLGVIAILAIICLLAFPPVLDAIKKSKNNINDTNSAIVFNACDLYIKNNNIFIDNKYCVQIQTLVDSGELTINVDETSNDKIKSTDYVKVVKNGGQYTYSITKNNECQ